jgi:hypothetical protein
MTYFAFKGTKDKSLWGKYEVEKEAEDNLTLCYNTLYLSPDELTAAPNLKLSFEDNLSLFVAISMAIACFSPDCGPFAVSFMSMFSLGCICLAQAQAESGLTRFVSTYLALVALSAAWGYFNAGLCSRAIYISQSLFAAGVQLLAWTGELRSKYWELDYLAWLTVGVFLFCAAKVGCTNPAISLFLLQGLKYSQLLMLWLCLYAVNPAESRRRLAEFPSYYRRHHRTEVMAYGFLRKLLITFFALSVMISLILGHRNRRRARAAASQEAGLLAAALDSR